jgi:L-asparagine transporter-like permease
MSIWAVMALGIGSMVGAGIFVLLGQTALVVGRDIWLAFAIGGVIALLSGLAYAGLAARYPSDGGIVDFFDLALPRRLAGGLSLLYLLNLAVATAMIAKTFGAYGVKVAAPGASAHLADLAGSAALVVLYILTSAGQRAVGHVEVVMVAIKLAILLMFMTGGLWLLDLDVHSSHAGSSPYGLISSVGITFFAYAGFGMMANTAGNVTNPERVMRIAFPAAIGFTAALYVGLALVVLSAIPPEALAANAETAVAAAAEPYFGRAGFVILSVAALLATASTMNANVYSGNEITRSLAAAGSLAAIFVAFGWRDVMLAVAAAVAVMAVAALITLPAAASARSAPSYGGSLGKILLRREVLGPIAAQAALTGAAFTVIGIWGAPWIASDFQRSTTTQALGLTAMAIAYAAGALASGIVFRLVGAATIPLALALGGALLSIAAFGLVDETWFVPFLVALGLVLSPSPLLTAELREAVPSELSVLAMSLSPMALGFGIFGCQTLSGIIIDAFPYVPGEHPPEAFRSMFGALALAAVVLVTARGSRTGSDP